MAHSGTGGAQGLSIVEVGFDPFDWARWQRVGSGAVTHQGSHSEPPSQRGAHDGTALYAGGQVNENDGFGGMLDGHGMAPSTRT